jgi:hypothetical protein
MIEPRRLILNYQFPRYHFAWDARRDLNHTRRWVGRPDAIGLAGREPARALGTTDCAPDWCG